MNRLCACGCGDPVKTPNGTWLRGHHPNKKRTGSLEESVDRYLSRCRRVGTCLFAPSQEGQYGEVRYNGRDRMPAHRAVYLVKVGPIPDGLVVRHVCDNRSCAEVSHLVVGTQSQNIRDLFDRNRRVAAWRQGDDHPCAVLTVAIVSELRQRAAEGAHLWDLAHEYGLNYLTMCSAIRGRSWAHVETPPVPGAPRKPSSRSLAATRPDDCIAAADLADKGLTLQEIGDHLGITRTRAWKFVLVGRGLRARGAEGRTA